MECRLAKLVILTYLSKSAEMFCFIKKIIIYSNAKPKYEQKIKVTFSKMRTEE